MKTHITILLLHISINLTLNHLTLPANKARTFTDTYELTPTHLSITYGQK